MFENKVSKGGVHYSRYCASWVIAGGGTDRFEFERWLKSLKYYRPDDDEIHDIVELFTNGKMELEYDAKMFISNFVYKPTR